MSRDDADAFSNAGQKLYKTYLRLYPSNQSTCFLKKAGSGRDIVDAINACGASTILSLDIVSHGNAGGLHIARDLTAQGLKDLAMGPFANLHMYMRSQYPAGHKVPTLKDAEFAEESMHGLYTDAVAKQAVAIYFNQVEIEGDGGIRYLQDIEPDRFANDCFVELHGCRTAEDVSYLGGRANFAKSFSSRMGSKGVVVGHTSQVSGNQNGRNNDYRHGMVMVYRNGVPEDRPRERLRARWANSSTPP
jgi:hypothetical protein